MGRNRYILLMIAVLIALIFSASSALANGPIDITLTTQAIKLVFTTPPQTMTAGSPSAIMTIQAQDASNDNPVNVAVDTTIDLTSSSVQGKFSLNASPWSDITSVTILGGSNSASFYYRDTAAGNPTITAAEFPDYNWTDATQQQTVISGGGGWGGSWGGGEEGGETSVETPAPAEFECGSLGISPTEVDIGETVNITILITNAGEQSGSYQVILKINGVAEVDSEVDIDAGDSKQVSFSITRDTAGIYSVDVNGLTGNFEVKPGPAPPVEPPPVTPVEPAPASPTNWWLIGGISATVVVAGSIIYLFSIRRWGGAARE